MKLTALSIYDSKIQAFLPPFYVRQEAQGIRWFQEQLLDANTDFGKYPEDYTLFAVHVWDDDTGMLDESGAMSAPTQVINGLTARELALQQRAKSGV